MNAAQPLRFSVILLAFLLQAAHASDEQDDLLKIEISAYQMSTAFSAFVFFEGDPRFVKQLQQSRQQGADIFKGLSAQYPGIHRQWQQASSFTADSENTVFDGSDLRLEIGLSVYQNELYRQINQKKSEHEESHNAYLQAQLNLEKILAQYMYSAISAGAYNNDNSMDENAIEFSRQIETVSHSSGYKRLARKWNFVKNRILNNKQQVTPFMTLHAAKDIRKLLAKAFSG